MKYNGLLFIIIILLFSCSPGEKKAEKQVELKISFGKVPQSARFINDSLSIWGASLVKGDDGLIHMYYSIWPKELGWSWVTHSVIAHAVSENQYGPFEFKDIALPVRGAEYWDGLCTHNPTVHKFENKYYLYYMGNTGDGVVPIGEDKSKEQLNWVHRNNQRIGVAVADNPNGPWKRFDKPLIEVSEDSLAMDALMTSNPAVTQRPDGGFLMVYKAVGKKRKMPFGGPVVHLAATSDSPAGPFVKHDEPIFVVDGVDFPAEDPYIWYQEGKYRAIVKNIETTADGKRIFSLVHYDSADGIDWKPAKNYFISDRTIEWENGRKQQLLHLERPQLYFENGAPVTLLCAADTLDEKGVRQTFNVQIPIIVESQQ
jgi:hypothetical protein